MRIFVLCAFLLLITACSADAPADPLPANVQLGADVILSQSTATAAQAQAQAAQANAQAAQARSQAIAAQGTAVRQVTLDAMNARSTDAAIRLQFAQVTQTTEARRASDVAAENARSATEIANAHAEATRGIETTIARQETRAAVQTATRRAEIAVTQTAVAAQPTQTRIAEIAAEDRNARQRAEQVAQSRAQWDALSAPLASAAFYLIPPLAICAFFIVLFYGLWRVLRAGENLLQSRALAMQSSAVKNLIIIDRMGNPIGWIVPAAGDAPLMFNPFDSPPKEAIDSEPSPPLLLTDSRDAPPAPREDLVNDMIHRSDLKVFTQLILNANDWTQSRWANYVLPRGFVLSTDTKDARGGRVHGGYARVMALYTEKNVIINRRRGTSGEWNPRVPKDADLVMGILTGDLAAPGVPEQAEQPPYPVASPALSQAA